MLITSITISADLDGPHLRMTWEWNDNERDRDRENKKYSSNNIIDIHVEMIANVIFYLGVQFTPNI